MVRRKPKEVWEFGDFQTPPALAQQVCARLAAMGAAPDCVLEPTCGRGAFLSAAARAFPQARRIVGVDINPGHLDRARSAAEGTPDPDRIELIEGDFFKTDWQAVMGSGRAQIASRFRCGPWLILGNPPWVTSAELGLLLSRNVPEKSNFHGRAGIDAMTGKSNFDISEWMLLRCLEWLEPRGGWIGVLLKTAVARKLMAQAWKRGYPFGRTAVFGIDAALHFGASVDACLFVAEVAPGARACDCPVFAGIGDETPERVIGFHDDMLISDIGAYSSTRHLLGLESRYAWRSGIKHDCSKVMELALCPGGYRNGLGEAVLLEDEHVFPMLKSSGVHKGGAAGGRFMLVPQRTVGGDTSALQTAAPLTWRYLQRHAGALAGRGSSIYRDRPPFSVFGVGDYSFAPWKVAISGFYKSLRFTPVAPCGRKPVVFDDTVYFLACQSEEEAMFLSDLLNSPAARAFYGSMVFWADKRPITVDLLRRLSLAKLAAEMGRTVEYQRHAPATPPRNQAPRGKANRAKDDHPALPL